MALWPFKPRPIYNRWQSTLFIISIWRAWKRPTLAAVGLFLLLAVAHNHAVVCTPSFSPSKSLTGLAFNATADRDADWSQFAYVQYVTDEHYLCNAIMFFDRLHNLRGRADRVLMYPSSMVENVNHNVLLARARDQYGVKLIPIAVHHRSGADGELSTLSQCHALFTIIPTFDGSSSDLGDSFTKLLVFNQTHYQRVLIADSDSALLQNLDELFFLPSAPIAMPRAYWLYPEKQLLTTMMMIVQPCKTEFSRVWSKIDTAGENDYDMEIINQLYKDSALVLPHRPCGLLTGEFTGSNHVRYLGNDEEIWNPVAVYNEAKLVHFSDWPLPKPWLEPSEHVVREREPRCVMKDGIEDCSARQIWRGFYSDFKELRKKRVCGMHPSQKTNT